MSTTTLIAATTAAVATQRVYSAGPGEVTFTATGLAGAETFTPFSGGGAAWTQLFDSTGAAITLTATEPQITLPGGVVYGWTKSTTAGAASLEAHHSYPY